MDKQLFDDAIGEVPASTVDVDAVIRRGRRAVLVARVANPVVAAGIAVLLLVGVVAVTMTRGDGAAPIGTPSTGADPSSTADQHPPTTTTESPTSSTLQSTPVRPPACDDPSKLEEPQQAIDRLDAAIGPVVATHVSPLQLTASPGAFIDGVQHGPLEFFQVSDRPGELVPICEGEYLLARAVTRVPDSGDGNVMVMIAPAYYQRPGAGAACDSSSVTPGQTDCRELPAGPDALAIGTTDLLANGVTSLRVNVVKADGTEIVIDVENSGTSSKVADGPTASTPPMTYDQMLAIALSPELTLFPNG